MQVPDSQLLHERNPKPHSSVGVEAVEDLRSGEHIPNLGGMAVADTAELPETPDVDVQQLESERKTNTRENLRALQKRFGERFVKGDLMEGGGYTGGAARELLAGFMDRPGLADCLKRLIPGKHGALALLKDNHAYIQATLEQWLQDDSGAYEREPAKDPYELARSVGYELTGPFQSTREFVPLGEKDFRPGERLCTFNEPTGRLRDYNILWLRHDEVDYTLPADQLTVDTLSETWKTYLKTIGRYDQDSDSYDLAGLRPTRDDPYGTSSMSVQISRQGTHVSIKNRYNHTVGNPDNTLDSDLDNVAYGLRRAVYTRVGREDLMDKTRVALAEGYIADNDGGIHHYQYEEENIYYGDYEYIENGVVTTIDRGRYYMISPQLYVPQSGKGDELRLGRRAAGITELEVDSDVRFLYESSKTQGNEKDPRISELRREYAERDHAELKALSVERTRNQIRSAYSAYSTVVEQLGHTPESQKVLEQLFAAKDKEWQESGVYDYLVEKLIADGARFNLVATPNVEASEAQVVLLAEAFGKDQPYPTYVYDDLYRRGHYTSQEWSGDKGAAPIHLSLIPDRIDGEMGNARVDSQVEQLRERRAKQPELDVRVPSVLEAVTYWYTLRAQGDKLDDSSAYDKTYIRHIELEPKTVVRWPFVPYSYVSGGGKPYLSDSNADDENDVRLSVG